MRGDGPREEVCAEAAERPSLREGGRARRKVPELRGCGGGGAVQHLVAGGDAVREAAGGNAPGVAALVRAALRGSAGGGAGEGARRERGDS